MKEIINWLIRIEEMAMRFYEAASRRFAEDSSLSTLLRELSEEERLHLEAVTIACELVKKSYHPPHIVLGRDTREGLDDFILSCQKRLDAGTLTRMELMDAIITLETSEINGLFLYAIDALKSRPGKLFQAVSNIRDHRERIRRFVDSHPEFGMFRERVNRMPDVARKNLLIVDDEEGVASAFNILLKDMGNVFIASNGLEALERISERDFAAVISDINMPGMNGIELYNEAVKKSPSLKDRFVFITGAFDSGTHEYLDLHSLSYLEKPASIRDIRRSVAWIIEAQRH